MVDRALIASKLTDLAAGSRACASTATSAELTTPRDASDLVAFNLMLAVQLCVDIASHLISDEGWPAAKTLGEGFTRLQEHQVIFTRHRDSAPERGRPPQRLRNEGQVSDLRSRADEPYRSPPSGLGMHGEARGH